MNFENGCVKIADLANSKRVLAENIFFKLYILLYFNVVLNFKSHGLQ